VTTLLLTISTNNQKVYPYDKLYLESHVQTLQLEQLDQLTVVANADKINLVTSNSHTNNNNDNGDNDVAAPVDQLDCMPPVMDLMTHNDHNLTIDLHHSPSLTHFATICNNNNNDNNNPNNLNNNHAKNTATMTITINTNLTAHDALLDFSKFRWLCACVVVESPLFFGSFSSVSILYILLSSISLSTRTVLPIHSSPSSCYFGTTHPISASSVLAQVVEARPRVSFIFTFYLARYS